MDDTNVKYPAGSLADQERATLSKIEADVAAGIGPDQDPDTLTAAVDLAAQDPAFFGQVTEAIDKGSVEYAQRTPPPVLLDLDSEED